MLSVIGDSLEKYLVEKMYEALKTGKDISWTMGRHQARLFYQRFYRIRAKLILQQPELIPLFALFRHKVRGENVILEFKNRNLAKFLETKEHKDGKNPKEHDPVGDQRPLGDSSPGGDDVPQLAQEENCIRSEK